MSKKNITIIIILGISVFCLLIGYITYNHFKSQNIIEKDGIVYTIGTTTASVKDASKAKKDKYTFDKIKGRNITSIYNEAFKGNTKVLSVVAPHLESIGYAAFENSLIETFISENINSSHYVQIEKNAFSHCKNLKTVVLGKAELQHDLFFDCGKFDLKISSDSSMNLDSTISQAASPFRNTTLGKIEIVQEEEKYFIYENGVLYYNQMELDLMLPNSLDVNTANKMKKKSILYIDREITELSFKDDEVIMIYPGASDNLKKISVNESNPYYSSINGILYSKDNTCLMYYPSKAINSALSDSLEIICRGSFSGNYNDIHLLLPRETQIHEYSFIGVTGLMIDLNYSKIDEFVFYDCDFKFKNGLVSNISH